MKSRLGSSPKRLIVAGGGAVVLLVAAIWFLAVSPQHSKATRLDAAIAAEQTKIDARRAQLAAPSAQVHVRASDLYRLTKAMPDQTDMAGIILALNRLAKGHGLSFDGIQPTAPVAQTGYSVLPVTVTVQGRFSAVSSFLRDLRRLVDVRKRSLKATGRLFSVDQFSLGQPDGKKAFPNVKATFTIDAFTFVGGLPAVPSTTTPSAPSGTVAAGATP
ncbi:MAG: type 4a pilus biogenesis protein PilO [Gaiellaceae bacterium]